MTRSSWPVAASIATSLLAFCGSSVLAQNSTAHLEIVLRDGKRQKLETFVLTVDEEKLTCHTGTFPRASIRMLCEHQCPDKLSTRDATEDVVVRLDGKNHEGHITNVHFDSDRPDDCFINQVEGGGINFKDVAYVIFAAPKK